jgi:hypothetical protein
MHAPCRYEWDLRHLDLVIEANNALEVAALGSIEAVNKRRNLILCCCCCCC